jgi:hypothetical protein
VSGIVQTNGVNEWVAGREWDQDLSLVARTEGILLIDITCVTIIHVFYIKRWFRYELHYSLCTSDISEEKRAHVFIIGKKLDIMMLRCAK